MPVNAFLAITQIDDVDGSFSKKADELAALQSADAIQAKPSLRELRLPQFPSDYAVLLTTTLEGVSVDIEAHVTAHMNTHTNGVRKSCLSDGLGFIKDDCCSFCGQSLNGIALIPAFTAYFGGAYKAHFRRISQMMRRLNEEVFSPTPLLAIQQTSLQNTNVCQSWHPTLILKPPDFPFDTISSAIAALRTASSRLLHAKQQTPFDAQPLDGAFLRRWRPPACMMSPLGPPAMNRLT
jgi:wobble nucleotide-excising tRNase